jgi:glycosyltransferase involved in cell wall biosynthesis
MPNSDIVVATAWQTAEWVSSYPEEKGCKFYLIQGQETVFPNVDPVRVMNTWLLPLRKIVIAKWLKEIAEGLGQSATYIPNGLNFDEFGVDVPPNERNRASVIMPYHDAYLYSKGSREGLEALYFVRRQVPDLKALLFGHPRRPEALPGWISYWQRPSGASLRRLYNKSAIFVGPSRSEGWGLPGCEAAQCGAALCVTDNGGHREYAIHEQTALLSPPKDHRALAVNILRLVRDDDLRRHLAMQAHDYVQQFTWAPSVRRLEQEFAQAVKERMMQGEQHIVSDRLKPWS